MGNNNASHDNNKVSGTYPARSFESCLNMVRELVRKRGEGVFMSKKDISVILGLAEPTLIYPISSSINYGLLDSSYGSGYKVTSLLQKIDAPVYPEDSIKAKIEALGHPPLYKQLIEKFNGKILPPEEGLKNHIATTKEYGIIENSAERAAKIFLENFRNLGLIDENNRLRYLIPNGSMTSAVNPIQNNVEAKLLPPIPIEHSKSITDVQEFIEQKVKEIPIPLIKGKVAYLRYPTSITRKDIAIIKHYIDGIDMTIEDKGEGEV